MALMSMTGYGRGSATARGVRVECEIAAVNRKQFDLRLTLPRAMAGLESRVQKRIQRAVARGQVTAALRIAASSGSGVHARVDEALARDVVRKVRRMAGRLGLEAELAAADVMRVPGVVLTSAEADETVSWRSTCAALDEALEALLAMRRREGAALEKDVARRVRALRRHHAAMARRAPRITARYRRGLLRRLAEAGVPVDAGDPAVVKDAALFAERADITEELVRLASHLDQAEGMLAATGPVGRRLDFLCQEMFREVNTIGAKASDLVVTRHVIDFKALLDTVREQLQNVE